MLTNILDQSTRLLCVGTGAMALVIKSFRLEDSEGGSDTGTLLLEGVVSRKKQLVPALTLGIQM